MEGKSGMVEERSWVWQFKSLPCNKPNYRVLNVALKENEPTGLPMLRKAYG